MNDDRARTPLSIESMACQRMPAWNELE